MAAEGTPPVSLAALKLPPVALPAVRPPQLGPWPRAVFRLLTRQVGIEAFGAPGYALTLAWPKATGLSAGPRDFRPTDPALGRLVLAGRFPLAGSVMDAGEGQADPWNRPSPTRRFAVDLHQFAWMPHLIAADERGAREALRLTLAWTRGFSRWNPFVWGRECLPRRVFNLACGIRRMSASAAEADRDRLADSLLAQARHLLRLPDEPAWAAEQACAAAVAASALAGAAAHGLLRRALRRLDRALERAVLTDGTHASRSPEAGLELLFDLLTLDDALAQRDEVPPPALARAIGRLGAALRVLTLADGRLAAFQGGEAVPAARVRAALVSDEAALPPAVGLAEGGYERLQGQMMQVMIDAAAPAANAYGTSACAHPAAIEVVCGRDRLITNTGWSERAGDRQGFRLTAGGSTVSLGEGSTMDVLGGWPAKMLGARLDGRLTRVSVQRRDTEAETLVEVEHDGWVAQTGLSHQRRLYLDGRVDELRAEDRLVPTGQGAASGVLALPYAVRFHLMPQVGASLARDRKSVLLRGPGGRGWWMRTDAHDLSLEPSTVFENGLSRRSLQVVLRGTARTDAETRIRWKLSPAGQAEGLT